ncbi:tripartite tricarboxylate transporter substrate binding protein [Bradyrhizobium sp.]|uniref:Bug family tripartite tricarboxylate transporter substrate binding protein n=1 Tax=Bradyrhizobium sp. TaxID=376 RepID=UPI001D2687BA|nr:tripartite tricarboxylate transporter substrate binding protein [Bradyrhizobium sp.]MBI5322438.1 tripartite tricarboxylate transporter substrate binding protein [Bradyrhizobium sp.]
MRLAAGLLFLSVLTLAPSTAAAQDAYPSRPVSLVHGFAAGGNADVISRIMADQLSKDIGQPVVVDARPGAGGNIASAFVAKAPADGYTIQLLVGGHTVSAALYKKLQFDPVKDYTFISTVARFPFFIAVKAGAYPSLQALIAKAKEKPGGLNFGSAGVGTTQHLTGELLAQRTGTRFTHIPYQGGSATVTALLRGDVDFIVDTGTVIKSQAAAGVIDILAVSSKERWSLTPDVPTVAETVARDFDIISWTGIGVPSGTPAAVVDKLATEVKRALANATVQERLRTLDSEPAPSSGAEMGELITRQIETWTRVVEQAGLEKR